MGHVMLDLETGGMKTVTSSLRGEALLQKWDYRFIELAQFISGWSKDPSTKVGAVIVDAKNRVVSVGFNGPPRGVADRFDRPTKLLRTVHAEANALHFATKDVCGNTIYITHPPCANCAANIIQRELTRVVTLTPPSCFMDRWKDSYDESLKMLREVGVEYVEVSI
jgi:dCMP deaminase